MAKEFELLKNPFDGLSNYEEIKDKCAEIAGNLFCNYGIECGNRTFRFAEIEFYYYDRNAYLNNKEQLKWQEVTYPRDDYEAGQLFYHLSGIDICFDSQYKNEKEEVKFGGILIRSIKDGEKIIAGPLNSKDEILNACKNGKMPELIEVSGKEKIELKQTYRSLGKTGTDTHDGLCFYDGSLVKDDWDPKRDRFDTKTGNTKSKKSSYNTSKFISV